eukprot:Rmarinus@m.29946
MGRKKQIVTKRILNNDFVDTGVSEYPPTKKTRVLHPIQQYSSFVPISPKRNDYVFLGTLCFHARPYRISKQLMEAAPPEWSNSSDVFLWNWTDANCHKHPCLRIPEAGSQKLYYRIPRVRDGGDCCHRSVFRALFDLSLLDKGSVAGDAWVGSAIGSTKPPLHGMANSVSVDSVPDTEENGTQQDSTRLVEIFMDVYLSSRLLGSVDDPESLPAGWNTCNPVSFVAKTVFSVRNLAEHLVPVRCDMAPSLVGHELLGCHDANAAFASRARRSVDFNLPDLHEALRPYIPTQPAFVGPIAGLRTTPRPYQRFAIAWMLDRERVCDSELSLELATGLPGSSLPEIGWMTGGLHPLWRDAEVDGLTEEMLVKKFPLRGRPRRDCRLYANVITGQLTYHRFPALPDIKGGILADEMGLGKTFEVLCLVLCNPRINLPLPPSPKVEPDAINCLCKDTRDDLSRDWVACDECGSWQHAQCVGFEINRSNRAYFCPSCVLGGGIGKTESGATLVVCPSTILQQWSEEVEKHTVKGFLNVHVYESVHSCRFPLSARRLAACDVVLTTYDVLRADVHHAARNTSSGTPARNLRATERYYSFPTPLLSVKWWRVCLDEAQMVEGGASKAAEMAAALVTDHRWCITGTPIQRGLRDLSGLLAFLRYRPFGRGTVFDAVVTKPFERGDTRPVCALLRNVAWGRSRADVEKDLNLPPQTECTTVLRFHPIERHWYRRMRFECTDAFNETFQRLQRRLGKTGLDHIGGRDLALLAAPLLRLRQACCHPQIGESGLRGVARYRMSMSEVVDMMLSKSRLECEEAQRELIFATNAVAALCAIDGEVEKAVSLYRECLAVADENKKLFRADRLQRLHTLYNLHDLLFGGKISVPSTVGRTLRDEQLLDEASCIRAQYLTDSEMQLHAAVAAFENAVSVVETPLGTGEEKESVTGWWQAALTLLENGSDAADFIPKVRSHLEASFAYGRTVSRIAQRFNSVPTFRMVVGIELEKLMKVRDDVLREVRYLSTLNSPQAIRESVSCRLCRPGALGEACRHCQSLKILDEYESIIYFMVKGHTRLLVRQSQSVPGDGSSRPSTKELSGLIAEENLEGVESQARTRDGELLFCLREISAVTRRNERDVALLSAYASKHLEAIEAMKKELHQAHVLWSKSRERLSALDELDMAQTRIRLRFPNEVVLPHEEQAKLHPEQVPLLNNQFSVQRTLAGSNLRRRKGQYLYLQRLYTATSKPKTTQDLGTTGAETESHGEGASRETEKTQGKCRETGIENETNAEGPKANGSVPELLSKPDALGEKVATEVCPICREEMEGGEVAMLPCGHAFCYTCILRLSKDSQKTLKCPQCRDRVSMEEVAIVLLGSPEGHPDPCEAGAEAAKKLGFDDETVVLSGSYGTKMDAILRRILAIRKKDPNAKTIVFSQWADVLKLLGMAMKENAVPHEVAEGSRGLHGPLTRFRLDPAIQVFLLPIRSCGRGLTITEASHVVLVEPILNAALDAQAISRVYRLGQTQPTFVHRFVVSDTIEEHVSALFASREKAAAPIGGEKGTGEEGEAAGEEGISKESGRNVVRATKSEAEVLTVNELRNLFEYEIDGEACQLVSG